MLHIQKKICISSIAIMIGHYVIAQYYIADFDFEETFLHHLDHV